MASLDGNRAAYCLKLGKIRPISPRTLTIFSNAAVRALAAWRRNLRDPWHC